MRNQVTPMLTNNLGHTFKEFLLELTYIIDDPAWKSWPLYLMARSLTHNPFFDTIPTELLETLLEDDETDFILFVWAKRSWAASEHPADFEKTFEHGN